MHFSLYLRCIIRLDELGQTIEVRLVMRLDYFKDVQKTYYTSLKTNYPSKFALNDALREIVRLDQAPVVRKVDNAIHRINHYPADGAVCFVNTYLLDSTLSCR